MFQFGRAWKFVWGTKPTKAFLHKRKAPLLKTSWRQGFRFGTGVIKLSLAMYPFSISTDEHVPLKFLMTKRLWKITRLYLPI